MILVIQLTAPASAMSAEGKTTALTQSDDAAIAHALSRLTYGARPGDILKVRAQGLGTWIESQLKPETIPDAVVESKLANLKTLSYSTAELREKYEVPPAVKKEMQREAGEGTPKKRSLEEMTPQERRASRDELKDKFPALAKMEGGPRQVIGELQDAKFLRATYSERQLNEIVVDFWFNHFNVFARKGPIEYMVGEYEREAIRKNAWGRFEDLLLATAQSPAMLFYLDNWLSSDPKAQLSRGPNRTQKPGGPRSSQRSRGKTRSAAMLQGQPARQRQQGLNENYARELMELHTLGVDGGYTQQDVVEVAKAFSGWTIRGEGPFGSGVRQGGATSFWFDDRRHVKGDKTVLGKVIKDGGEKEGREIIALLAAHPATAKFIATKLAQRFVADKPPLSLVNRAAETFTRTKGDIREVIRTIVTSAEFFDPAFRGAKIKTPLEFVVSAVRASGASVEQARGVTARLNDMGMPSYLQQPPTGYRDTAEEWVSTSSLLARMNFALDLAAERVRGVRLPSGPSSDLSTTPPKRLDAVAKDVLPGGLSAKSRETLLTEAEKDPTDTRILGLVLGSPEFQRK